VGKTCDTQVRRVPETSLDNNLAIIEESIAFLKSKGLTVFFDAEHFFDGFKSNPAYALNGQVNALDRALRKALLTFYPGLSKVDLIDYKVRILEGNSGTGSLVRVFIESSNGRVQWRTVGGSTNIIEASWLALNDSMEYFLVKLDKKSR